MRSLVPGLRAGGAARHDVMSNPSPPAVSARGRTFWVVAHPSTARRPGEDRVVHLLPNYDELLVAFRDRSDAIDPGLPADDRFRFGPAPPNFVVGDSLVMGSCRRIVDRRAVVAADLPVDLNETVLSRLRAAAEGFAPLSRRPVSLTGVD